MRRFLAHLLAFVALQAVILVLVWRSCPRDEGHYMAATIDKHARLRAAASPRLILVGGSNMGFSVDSRAFVERGLGLAPVNMGLNDGLGLDFMLAEVAGQLRAGDVVIVAPETSLYWTGSRNDAIWAVLEHRPASVGCLSPTTARELSDQGLHFLARKVRCAVHQVGLDSDLANVYRRDSFDEYGDFVAHRGLAGKHEATIDRPWPPLATLDFDPAIARLREFADTCARAHARCYLAWSPTRRFQYDHQRELFAALEARLRELDLPMLESSAEAVFADDQFFDRGPHLTGDAAARRSARLAERLASASGS
ncbi:hypothetical protein ACNOYE_01830 [Nannocystaceae bacterium ST9]